MIPFDSFKILIVGAGPAGSCAAAAAARAGVSTLLIDAKPRIGGSPHCAEFVPKQLFRKLQLAEDCIVQSVDCMETRITDLSASSNLETGSRESSNAPDPDGIPGPGTGKAPLADPGDVTVTDSPGFMIDRARFDRCLAREAAAAGATVLSSTRLLRRSGDYWSRYWILRYNGEEVKTHPRYVIAADGALSTVASLFSGPQRDFLMGMQIEAPLTKPLDRTFVFLDPCIFGGYGWLFPKRDVCNVGIGMLPGTDPHPRRIFEAFVEMLLSIGMIRPGRLARSSGVIPVRGLRKDVVHAGVIYCGDAAGLTHPITGAGVPQAVLSGHLAGVSAAAAVKSGDKKHLDNYETEIQRRYGGPLNHALDKRLLMMSRWWDADFASLCRQTWIAFKGYAKRVR
ncbi:MAG: NAD(P)/FAD-dependent oxidoreductase [Pseudomonadota bacterium]